MKTLIIGASGELGSAIAKILVARGHKVVLHGFKNIIKLNNLADEVNAIDVIVGDVTKEDDIIKIINNANKEELLTGLVYAAGINPTAETIAQTSLDKWNLTIQINLTGAFLCIKYVLPFLRQTELGSIVIVSSIFGIVSPANRGAYGASKHALTGLIQSTAKEEGDKVRINGVCPGPMWSENVRNIFSKHAHSVDISVEEYIKERQGKIPYGRFLELDECAAVIRFLLSEDSKFLTGEIIRVSGGET